MEENKEVEEEIKGKKSVRNILLCILILVILVISVISLSFASFQKEKQDDSSNSIKTGNISMNYTESVNGISINNAMPISDTVGKSLNGEGECFDFTINTTIAGDVSLEYEIAAIKDETSTIPDSNIKLYLEQQVSGSYEQIMAPTVFTPIESKSNVGSPAGSMILKTVTKEKTSSDNYRLRMWIDENATVGLAQTYTIKVNVYGKALQ